MKANFGEVKNFYQDQDAPQSGWFAFMNESVSWIECREQFHRQYKYDNGFFFSHSREPNIAENIANFVIKAEEVIRVTQPIEHSTFSKTNKNYALWVEPSVFWRQCRMRMCLFTILLRAGSRYDPQIDNFEKILYSEEYVASTILAVKRFLYGFTTFPDGVYVDSGWVNAFKNQEVEKVCERLKFPAGHSEVYYINGGPTLWM